jgi:transposase
MFLSWKRVKSANRSGVEEWRWKQTRTFECNHETHQGTRKINRDKNASANIALNVILFAFGALDDTTWKIGSI